MSKSYTGFIEPEILDEDWNKLGAVGDFPYTVYQPNGNWSKYLPSEESQKDNTETTNCTAFGTASIIETLAKRIEGKEYNLSDRYVGLMSGTYPPGNDPQKVAQAIRRERACNEATMPFKDIDNVDEYYSWKGVDKDKAIEEAHKFPYKLLHTYLWTSRDNPSKEQQKEMIIKGLRHSPIGVSVTAWYKNGEVYVDRGKPNTHWTVIYGVSDKGYLCFDSYYPYKKIISFDHDIRYAKIYDLEKTPSERPKLFIIKSLWEQVLSIYQIIAKKKDMTKQERLLELAKSKIGTDFTPDWIVDDSVSCAYALTTILNELDKEIPIITGTWALDDYLSTSNKFKRIPDPITKIKAGSIVISPTGQGNGNIIGHCGIYLTDTIIMSNNSLNGLWEGNFTRETWRNRYLHKGGLPIRIYELVD